MFCGASPAQAACRELGGIGVMFGAMGGVGATVVGGFAYPGIAVAVKPGLRYWQGVGYTLLGGALATVASTAAVIGDCSYPETIYVPPLVTVPVSALTTVLWASLTKVEPPPVALAITKPSQGDGAVMSIGGRF